MRGRHREDDERGKGSGTTSNNIVRSVEVAFAMWVKGVAGLWLYWARKAGEGGFS